MDIYSRGKLLLTGEYFVMDGANALAVPTVKGQHLKVEKRAELGVCWESFDCKAGLWFKKKISVFEIEKFQIEYVYSSDIETVLMRLLKLIYNQKPRFFYDFGGYKLTFSLEFSRKWGLGSSSTMIANLARWADVNPYELNHLVFGGSGYDIAIAMKNKAILYSLKGNVRRPKPINFNPPFLDYLFLVYMNKKQSSLDAVQKYRQISKILDLDKIILELDVLTQNIVRTSSLEEFERNLNEHEHIISSNLKLQTVKSQYFRDYTQTIKSLGAWGGDFVLVTGRKKEVFKYFKKKGYNQIFSYQSFIYRS